MNTNTKETTNMGSEIVPAPSGQMSLAETVQLAEIFTKSRFFADVREAAQAVVKILAGRELGFGPMASMTGIHVIEGKPNLSANLMAALIKRSDHYDYDVTERSREACELLFWERSGSELKGQMRKGREGWAAKPIRIRVTLQECLECDFPYQRGGKDLKPNWKNYPDDMLFARAISKGFKTYCADLTAGVIVYAEGEIEADPPQIVSLKDEPQSVELVHKAVLAGGNQPREEKPAEVIDGQQYEHLARLIHTTGADRQKFLDFFQIKGVAEMPRARYAEAISLLERKARRVPNHEEPKALGPVVDAEFTVVPGLELRQIMILNNLAGLADIPPAMLCSQLGIKSMDQVPAYAYLWLRLMLEEKADIADSLKFLKVQSITEVTEERLTPLALNKLRGRIDILREQCGTETERFNAWVEERYKTGFQQLTTEQLVEVEGLMKAACINQKKSKEKAKEAVTS